MDARPVRAEPAGIAAVWQAGFDPPADLFLVDGMRWQAATEALVARGSTAGVVGVGLIDPVASAARGELVTRRP